MLDVLQYILRLQGNDQEMELCSWENAVVCYLSITHNIHTHCLTAKADGMLCAFVKLVHCCQVPVFYTLYRVAGSISLWEIITWIRLLL